MEYHGNGPGSCLKPEVVCCFCNVHVGEEGTCYCALAQVENSWPSRTSLCLLLSALLLSRRQVGIYEALSDFLSSKLRLLFYLTYYYCVSLSV